LNVDGASLTLVLGAALTLFGLRTRYAAWASLLGLSVVALALGVSVFDGESHARPDEKMDGTIFVWMGAVLRRALAGVVLVVLALPMSRAFARSERRERWWLPGVLLGGLPGVALAGSSLLILDTMKRVLDETSLANEQRIAELEQALGRSDALLGSAAAVAALGGAWLAWREATRSGEVTERRS
jgi:hypothetical protein